MSVLDCRIGICFSLVVLKSDLDMFLLSVPSFSASFRRTHHSRVGEGTEIGGRRRREYDLSPIDNLQIVFWQLTFYKTCYPEHLFKIYLNSEF